MVFNGEKLREIRIKRGYTQKQLADIMGVSQAMITQYETKKRTPKLKTAQRFAHILKIDFTALYDDSEPLTEEAVYNAELSAAISFIRGLGLTIEMTKDSKFHIYYDTFDTNGNSCFSYTLSEESLLSLSDDTRKNTLISIIEKSLENKDKQIIKPNYQINTSFLNELGIQKVQEFISDISLIDKYTK